MKSLSTMALSRQGIDALASAIRSSTSQAVTILYNQGHDVIDSHHKQPIVIYNTPGSTFEFASSTIACSRCTMEFVADSLRVEHQYAYPKTCRLHKHCFVNWKDHVAMAQCTHTRCPIPGCAKAEVEFKTNARFLQHFRNKHS